MAGSIARRWRAGGVLLGLAMLALPVSAAGATTTSPTGIQIGPLKLANGYSVTINSSCTAPYESTYVLVMKSGRQYSLTHDYYRATAGGTSCSTSSTLGSGTLSIRWGAPLYGKLKFSKPGRVRRLTIKSCAYGKYRSVTGKGSLKLNIHARALGKLNLRTVKGQIQEYTGGCPSPNANGVGLYGSYKTGSVSGFAPPKGQRSISVTAPDNVSKQVHGTTSDTFLGQTLFSFKSNLSVAKLTGLNPFLTGTMKYKAIGTCLAGSSTGTLSGKLVLHDPVSGRFTYLGSKAIPGTPSMYNTKRTC